MINRASRILYCHCAYAKVVPPEVKTAVLTGLTEADVEFEAVPDLCEMAAHGDERLREIAAGGRLEIAACYPRAVKWLFAAAGAQLTDDSRVWNMRVESADTIIAGLVARGDRAGESGPTVEVSDVGAGSAAGERAAGGPAVSGELAP